MLTRTPTIIWLNIAAVLPFLVATIFMTAWWRLVVELRGPQPGSAPPWWLVLLVAVLVLPLHEWLHGLAIQWAGHKPRYGARLKKFVFYATADNALFRRDEFLVVAAAPLVVITLAGMVLMLALPDAYAYLAGLMVVINAASAVGDLWMIWVVLSYPPAALVRDEADSIRIFLETES